MTTTSDSSYPYKPSGGTYLLGTLLFGAGAVMFAWKAVGNEQGLIINGLITLSPAGAAVFYWVLAGLCFGCVLLACLLSIDRAFGRAELRIGASSITLPEGFVRRSLVEIPFSEITTVSETELGGHRFFYFYTGRKKHCINQSLMPSELAYEEAKGVLLNRITANRADSEDQS